MTDLEIALPESGEIIMVDDSEADIYITKKIINQSQLKHKFLSFTDGQDFLNYMQKVHEEKLNTPNLILLDINMPGLNGFEILEKLRQYSEFSNTPEICFYTNSNDPRDKEKVVAMGAFFQEKFFKVEEAICFFNSMVRK